MCVFGKKVNGFPLALEGVFMSQVNDKAAMNIQEEDKMDRRRRPQRRIEILQAVMTLLEKGNRRVTTADLAAEVGLSEAALYRHFSGKDAIFQALTEYLQDHLIKPADQLAQTGSSLLQLRRLFEYHLRFFAEHPGLCRVFLVEGVMTRSESVYMGQVVKQYGQQVKQMLTSAQEAGELPAQMNLESAADFFVGLIQSATLRFVISGFTESPMDEIPALWAFFSRGVGAVENSPIS